MNTDILNGRTVVITGATSGIGEACALTYASVGAQVVAAGRRDERLRILVRKIVSEGGKAIGVVTDVTSELAVMNLFDQALSHFGTVDVLINNAGVASVSKVEDCLLDSWNHVLTTNLTSAFLCSREAFKLMKLRRRGRIVNVGSISARVPRAHTPAYTASKFGLEGLTRALAIDGREFNIAVSLINPGIVATDLAPESVRSIPDFTATPKTIADAILHMTALPDHLNFYEAMIIQNRLPFLGRG